MIEMEWYKELGFEENPFELNPLNIEKDLVGRKKEAEEILYRIESKSMVLIEGKKGYGKTTLLKYAIENFKGEGKVIYVDTKKITDEFDINQLLYNKKKGMILLLDNIKKLSKANNEKIKHAFDEDRIRSVIFTANKKEEVSFPESIWSRIGRNIITLKPLPKKDFVQVVDDRITPLSILPKELLEDIYKSSDNTKVLLNQCYLLCEYVVDQGGDIAERKDLEILKLNGGEE